MLGQSSGVLCPAPWCWAAFLALLWPCMVPSAAATGVEPLPLANRALDRHSQGLATPVTPVGKEVPVTQGAACLVRAEAAGLVHRTRSSMATERDFQLLSWRIDASERSRDIWLPVWPWWWPRQRRRRWNSHGPQRLWAPKGDGLARNRDLYMTERKRNKMAKEMKIYVFCLTIWWVTDKLDFQLYLLRAILYVDA